MQFDCGKIRPANGEPLSSLNQAERRSPEAPYGYRRGQLKRLAARLGSAYARGTSLSATELMQ